MTAITVIATIQAKTDSIDIVKAAATALVPLSQAETGCLQYQLHQGIESPQTLIFYELWDNQTALDAHNQSAHLRNFIQHIDGLCDRVDIQTLQRI